LHFALKNIKFDHFLFETNLYYHVDDPFVSREKLGPKQNLGSSKGINILFPKKKKRSEKLQKRFTMVPTQKSTVVFKKTSQLTLPLTKKSSQKIQLNN
jgi:hypothetical protein